MTELSYCVVNTGGRDYLLDCLAAIERTHPEGVSITRCSCSTTPPRTGPRRPCASATPRRGCSHSSAGRGRRRTTPRSCARRAVATACCSTRTRSSTTEPCGRCSTRSTPTPAPRSPARSCSTRRTGRCRAPGGCRISRWALAAAVFMHDRVAVESTRRARARGGLGAVERRARAARGGRAGGLARPGLLRVLGRDRLLQAAARRGLADPVRAGRAGRPPQPAQHRRRGHVAAGSSSSTATATSTSESTGCAGTAARWKVCWTWAYLVRAAAAAVLPGRDPRRYLLHARQELFPRRGEGIRDAAEARNRALANKVAARHGAR